MATTAILSALAEEQQGLMAQLQGTRRVQRAGREFWLGSLHGQVLVLGLSRIGKVAAATTATALIEHFAAQRIVFTGVAGALGDYLSQPRRRKYHIGTIALAAIRTSAYG